VKSTTINWFDTCPFDYFVSQSRRIVVGVLLGEISFFAATTCIFSKDAFYFLLQCRFFRFIFGIDQCLFLASSTLFRK
jgi:hypothetical protein